MSPDFIRTVNNFRKKGYPENKIADSDYDYSLASFDDS